MSNHNDIMLERPLEKEKIYEIMQKNSNLERYYIAILDIDNFHYFNNHFGHSAGDKFIVEYGEKLVQAVGDMGIVYKFNGDEFILLLEKTKFKEIDSTIQWIQKKLNEKFKVGGYEIVITSSIGIYEPKIGENIEELVRKAYLAHYHAKEKGKNQYAYYTEEIEEQMKRKLLIVKELKKCLRNKNCEELYLVYQPIYSIEKEKIEEVEALMRWDHLLLGDVSPSEFIPIAEESIVMKELGYWLIYKVFQQIKKWEKEGIHLRVSINLSPKQVEEKFLNNIKKLFEKEKILYQQVKFEITETQILSLQEKSQKILQELMELGIDIAIDDFGEGYSSMKNLIFFPINEIKIDKCFTDLIHKDMKTQLMISALISFAKKAGYTVIAEGVENEEQFNKYREYGCDKIQGCFISKPMKEHQIKLFTEGIANKINAVQDQD